MHENSLKDSKFAKKLSLRFEQHEHNQQIFIQSKNQATQILIIEIYIPIRTQRKRSKQVQRERSITDPA